MINIKFAIFVATSTLLYGCSFLSNYNAEICTRIMEAKFESVWVESFSPAAKMDPNSCAMIVEVRSVIENQDYDILSKYELNATYKVFESGEFSYNHTVNKLSNEQVSQRSPSKNELLEIADKWDAKYGNQDICTGYLRALINNELTGTGQQMCQKPPQFRDY